MVDSSPLNHHQFGENMIGTCSRHRGKDVAKLSLNYQGENGYGQCSSLSRVSDFFCTSSALISKGIYDIPNKYPPYKVYMGLIIMYRYHPKGTDSKTKSLASNRMEKKRNGLVSTSTCISPLKHGSFNYIPILGGSNNANVWVVFRDFPCKSVLFGLVKS